MKKYFLEVTPKYIVSPDSCSEEEMQRIIRYNTRQRSIVIDLVLNLNVPDLYLYRSWFRSYAPYLSSPTLIFYVDLDSNHDDLGNLKYVLDEIVNVVESVQLDYVEGKELPFMGHPLEDWEGRSED